MYGCVLRKFKEHSGSSSCPHWLFFRILQTSQVYPYKINPKNAHQVYFISKYKALILVIVSNDLLGNPKALRERMAEKGYLFFKGIIPKGAILKVRQDFTRILAKHDWIRGGKERMNAVALRSPIIEDEHQDFWCSKSQKEILLSTTIENIVY